MIYMHYLFCKLREGELPIFTLLPRRGLLSYLGFRRLHLSDTQFPREVEILGNTCTASCIDPVGERQNHWIFPYSAQSTGSYL